MFKEHESNRTVTIKLEEMLPWQIVYQTQRRKGNKRAVQQFIALYCPKHRNRKVKIGNYKILLPCFLDFLFFYFILLSSFKNNIKKIKVFHLKKCR